MDLFAVVHKFRVDVRVSWDFPPRTNALPVPERREDDKRHDQEKYAATNAAGHETDDMK